MGGAPSAPSSGQPKSANVGLGTGSYLNGDVKRWETDRRESAIIGASCGCGDEEGEEKMKVDAPVQARAGFMERGVERFTQELEEKERQKKE